MCGAFECTISRAIFSLPIRVQLTASLLRVSDGSMTKYQQEQYRNERETTIFKTPVSNSLPNFRRDFEGHFFRLDRTLASSRDIG